MKNGWHIIAGKNGKYGIAYFQNDLPRKGIYNLSLEKALNRINEKAKV